MNEIRRVLHDLLNRYKNCQGTNTWYQAEELDRAESAILKELEGMMPPKETCKEGEQYWMWNSLHNVYEYGVMIGRNQMLSDLKSSLKKEGGGE